MEWSDLVVRDCSHILVTTGTIGDVAPFIAYAKLLQRNGLSPVVLSNENHEHLSLRHNVRFGAICKPDWPQMGRDEPAFFAQHILPGYYCSVEKIAELSGTSANVSVIARTGHWGAQFASERLNLHFLRLALQPCAIRRHGHPASSTELEALNRLRSDIGLAVLDSTEYIRESWENTECLFPKWFGEPETDWPQAGICRTFMYLDDPNYRPDIELATFLTRRPVIFSLGSGMQSSDFFRAVADSVAMELNLPILFLSAFNKPSRNDTSLVLTRSFADHAYVFQHARAILHNGGVGTIAQAIRARVPQIVVPLLWDQPDNAIRVERLGLGVVLPIKDLCCKNLVSVLRDLGIPSEMG